MKDALVLLRCEQYVEAGAATGWEYCGTNFAIFWNYFAFKACFYKFCEQHTDGKIIENSNYYTNAQRIWMDVKEYLLYFEIKHLSCGAQAGFFPCLFQMADCGRLNVGLMMLMSAAASRTNGAVHIDIESTT